MLRHAIPEIHAQWLQELEVSALPYPQRRAHRKKVGKPAPGINPLVSVASVNYGNYDDSFTAYAAMRRLLYKAAVYRLKERSAPALDGAAHMMQDPLTGDDFGQEKGDAETRLHSRASWTDEPVDLSLQPHPSFLWPSAPSDTSP